MQNTVSNSANSASEPQLPFEPGLDFSQPIQFRFNQLRAIDAAATRAGFRMVRLTVLKGVYEGRFIQEARLSQSAAKDATGASLIAAMGTVGAVVAGVKKITSNQNQKRQGLGAVLPVSLPPKKQLFDIT